MTRRKDYVTVSNLKAVGLEANAGLILIYNLSENDRGPTDHEAVAVVKLTGAEEAQVAFTCADSAYGSEAMFKLGCGAIAPTRDGNEPRAIAIRLPLGGAPILTTAVFAGAVFQSKKALAQRVPVLEQGLRQMVLEAAQLAHQEQVVDANGYQRLIDAGPEASSAAAVEHAEHSLLFTKSVSTCLELITTEPDKHYSLYFLGLDWTAGRAFCVTANIGIPFGPQRNKLVGQILRDGFTATVVRVFDGASSTDQVHFEAMAQARSSIDRLLHTGVLPPSMTERLQCTLPDQPFRLMRPGPAAHAVVTPNTLRARLHTASMWRGHHSDYAYDQLDRQQRDTMNEVNGEIEHGWDEPTANAMMQKILDVATLERITINLSVTSATTFAITPGPNPNDSSHLEKTCRAYCDRLRLSGETGLSCRFDHAPPQRPNPIPQTLLSVMQYEPDVYAGMARWSRCSLRRNDAAPELEGGGARFDIVAQEGTGRFQPPSGETALALRSTNNELVRSNASLKQQVAKMGAEQLTLRSDTRAQIQAIMETHQEETRKYMAEMRELHRITATAASETQAKLDALVKAVTTLPEGARVLHSVFSSTGALGSPTSETSEPEPPEPSGATAEEDTPPPTGGAPPSPENANGLDDEREPSVRPTTTPLPDARHITTPRALAERLSTVMRNGTAGISRRPARSQPSDCPPGPGPSGKGLEKATSGTDDAPHRLPTRSHILDSTIGCPTSSSATVVPPDARHECRVAGCPRRPLSDPSGMRQIFGLTDRDDLCCDTCLFTDGRSHTDICNSASRSSTTTPRHVTDAHATGPVPLSPGATPSAPESDRDERTETSSSNAAPGTSTAASPEGNAALRLERALLLDAIRIRRAHMLRTLELARTWWCLAEASCDRNACLPDHEALLLHLPTGLDSDPHAERAPTRAERPNIQDRQTPPQRHPDDPLDPCDSFSTMTSPAERNRSHARILWALAVLDGAMDQSDDARNPQPDGQEVYASSTCAPNSMPPPEEPTPQPTPDPYPSPAQPIYPNRHLTDDERGTSSKYPEVKGDGAWPPGKAPPPAQESLEDFNRNAAEAYFASMEAVRVNPSAALDLVMLQALDKMLAGIKVRDGRAPPCSLAQYGYCPSDSLLPNRQLTEDERGVSAKYPEVKGDGAMAKAKKKATTTAATETATTRSLAIVMIVPPDGPFDDGPEPEGGNPNDELVDDDEKDEDGDEADGSAHGDDHYEDTPPSSTDHPRPEHMVNAAVPDGRGVMIRAGSGFGSSVSDENSVRPPEHVSANEKASPPAQDSREDSHPPDGANSGFQAGRTTVDSILPLLLAAFCPRATSMPVVLHPVAISPADVIPLRQPGSTQQGVEDALYGPEPAHEAAFSLMVSRTQQARIYAAHAVRHAVEHLVATSQHAAEARHASMEAVRTKPSAAQSLVMLQTLGRVLAGVEVREGGAPPCSLSQYGYHPNDSLLPNRHLTEDERGVSAKHPEVKGDGAMTKAKKKATTTAATETATTRSLANVMIVPPDGPFDDGPEPEGGNPNDVLVGDDEKDEDGDEADGSAHGDDHYEDTPPSSTDHPRPEHMVNAAVPDGRGVMIRAGSGFGSSVSDENSVRPPEHVSANEKASPPAQDSREDSRPPASELVAYEEDQMMEFLADDRFRDERCFSLHPVLAHERMMLAHEQTMSSHGYHPKDSLPPNRHLTEDERGVSAKYPEVKGDGAMARKKKRATTAATTKAATTRSLAIVMTVPSDEPYDDGMDTPTAPGPWFLISGPATAPEPPLKKPSPPSLRHSRASRSHSPTSERTRQSQAADPPSTGNELGPLVRPKSFAQGPAPPTASARGRRHSGWNHRREHEHLHNEYGEQLTEEEHLAKALHESMVTSGDHACTPPDADDPDPSATENRAHPAAINAARPSTEREVNLNDGDVVSDEEEILHLAAALDASTTGAVAAAPKPEIRYSLDSPVTGTIADLVRPVGPSDKIRAKNAKYRDYGSDDDDTSGDSDFGDTGNEPNSTAAVANGKRPRAGFRTTRYWRQKPVPEQEWHKRQVREAHLADELTRPDISEVGRDFADSGATETDSDGNTIGHVAGPAGGHVEHIFRRRVTQLVPRDNNAEPDNDANGAPDEGGGFGPVCRAGRFDALRIPDSNGSSGGSEAPPAPDVEQAFPGCTGARPLRKLQLKRRPMVSRAPPHTGPSCTAPYCAIEGCGRLPRIRYTDRRTEAVKDVCCLDCCYNVRDEEGVKVHTEECDTLQRKHDDEVDAALEPAPGAHRENDITRALWSQPWWWTTRPGSSPQWRNRHLTETEQSITSSFPIVTGDGAMRIEDAEISDAFKPALRPFNHDDADYLGVHPVALGVLNDFVFHAVNRNVNGSDELYSDPTPETRLDVERSCEMLQAIRLIQQRKAGLNLLTRYGYSGPWGAHDPGTATIDPFLALIEVGIMPGPDIIEDTCARTYVGRMVVPTTDAQAHAAGLTIETAANLSSYLLCKAEEFVSAADAALTCPSLRTNAEKRHALRRLHECISVQQGLVHVTALSSYAYHDADGVQHLWFVPDDHECDRHLSATEQGITAAFPEVTGDGAARKLPSNAEHDTPARFVSEHQEFVRLRAGITTEGAEALHHFVGVSLRCATHAQSVYHRRPCEATATAMEEARTMVSDGINVLLGKVPPSTLARYTCNDDGIYGCHDGDERAFTREMLNMPSPAARDELTTPTVATPEFLAQQRNRRSAELGENPPCARNPAGTTVDAPSPAVTPPPRTERYTVRHTQTRVWKTSVTAKTAEHAERKASGLTRGWTYVSDDVVLEATAMSHETRARPSQPTAVVEPARRTRLERVAQHMIGPVPAHSNPQGTHTSAGTDAAPAPFDSDASDALPDDRRLTDTEKGITASFPEVTGDGAEPRLDDLDLDAVVTAQRARSIGITPPTTTKLRAFLQWVLDHHLAAEARHGAEPNGGYGRESHGFRTLALTALDVVHGRMPLWALGKFTDPRYDTTELLFTDEEVVRARPHFRSAEPTYLFRPSSERPPPDLSRLDSRVTAQQANLIGVTMDTAVKLSAFIEEADEREAAATEADRIDGSDTAAALRLSLRRREAVVKVACGQAPLSTLASLRHANGRGGRIFSSSEINRAKACSVIRHPVPPQVGERVVLAGLSRADLNGQLATVVAVTDPTDSARAQVRLDSTGKTVRIKRTNLRTGPIERATHDGPEVLSAQLDLKDAWPATPAGAPQGTVEGNGPFRHAHGPLPRNRPVSDDVVLEAKAVSHETYARPSQPTAVVEPARRTRLERVAQHMIGPVPAHANPQGTHTNAGTDTAPALFDSGAADALSDDRRLTDTEKGITASFPEVTGDGAEPRLDDLDLDALVTAQRARSIGITPPTTAKLRAFLQWVLGHHLAAEARHAAEPNGGYGRESHGFRTLALTALDVVHGRMPLWALGKFTDPRYDTTERLFTDEEVERAQPHFRPAERTYIFRSSSEQPPPDLSRLDSRVTAQQANLIGVTMDTAVKLSAFIEEADEREAAATEADRTDGSDTAAALRLSLRRREAVVKVACGQAPLATLASLRHANGRGGRIFSASEIERAKACSVIRHLVPLQVGERVELVGLSRADLNGQLATVVTVTDPTDSARAQARLDSTGKTVRIKRTNLRTGPTERATREGPGVLNAQLDLKDAWPATPADAPQGTVEGNGPFRHAHGPLPRNRHLTEREQGTSKDHPEVKGDGASAGVPTGLWLIATAADWLFPTWQRGCTPPLAEHEQSLSTAGRQTDSADHGNGQARPSGTLYDDDAGASSRAPTASPTGTKPDAPAQPPPAPNLRATVGTDALRQGVTPAEPIPLPSSVLTSVATPVRVGDQVAARQASFTKAWHRAWVVRVTTSRSRPVHTVQWEDGSITADIPLSRLRSLKPLEGPPDGDTTAELPPPAAAAKRPTTNVVRRAVDP